jgi:WD40 repeat protein
MKTILKIFLFGMVLPPALICQNLYIEPLVQLQPAKGPLTSLKFNQSGTLLAISGADKTIKLLDPQTLTEKISITLPVAKAYGVAFTEDGRSLISGGADGQVTVWDASKGTSIKSYSHGNSVRAVDVDPAGRIASGGVDKDVKMWDMVAGNSIGKFPSLTSEIMFVAYCTDTKTIIACCADGSVHLLDPYTMTIWKSMTDKKSVVTALALSSDGKLFVTAHADSTLGVWNAKNGFLQQTLRNDKGVITSAVFHPGNKFLMTASGAINFWDVATMKIVRTIADTGFNALTVAFSQQNSLLASTAMNGSLKTFRVLERKPDTNPPVIVITKPAARGSEGIQLYAHQNLNGRASIRH